MFYKQNDQVNGMTVSEITAHHSFSILSDDRSKASSKTMPPYSAMQSLLLQMSIILHGK